MTAAAASDQGFASRLFASGALAFLTLGMVPALAGAALPVWSDAFGLAPGQGGLFITLYNGAAAVVVIAGLAGVPGLTTRPALGIMALALGAMALAPGWIGLLGGATLAGVAYGILATVINRRFLTDFGPRGPGMVGLVNGLFGLGAIAAPLLFLAAGESAAPVFWGIAALALAGFLLARPEPFRSTRTGLPAPRRRHLLVLLNTWAVVMEGLLMTFGAAALVAQGASEPQAARLLSAFFATFLAARLSLYWVARLVAPRHLFALGAAGMTATALLAATVSPAAGFVLAGAFAGTCFPAFFVWGARLLGTDPRMGALILLSGFAGGTLGPLAARPILAGAGEQALFWIVAAMGVMLLAALALLGSRLRAMEAA